MALDCSHRLYLMDDPLAQTYQVVEEDIGDVHALEWFPGGDWLAFTGYVRRWWAS